MTPFNRWTFVRECSLHEEGEVCTCAEADKTRVWSLNGTSGRVQQFQGSGPFYGTWGHGRTGAMTALDSCKMAVEKALAS